MNLFDTLRKPTLLLDERAAQLNIQRMAAKARASQVIFRPHFKTHQSLEIGQWFRAVEIDKITVSSVDMASYFAAGGWNDITLAFSANIRQGDDLDELAGRVHLGLLVESIETVQLLRAFLTHPVDVWIKVDSGAGRTGLAWNKPEPVLELAQWISRQKLLRLAGLLTHAGNTYAAPNPEAAAGLFSVSVARMQRLQQNLSGAGLDRLQISVGDTPGCSALESFQGVDEIRPGNFVFYDAQQLKIGSCRASDLAVALACPVVALHPERSEAVVYGGAIHLSKDTLDWQGERVFGLVAPPAPAGWGEIIPGGVVARLSQEHGILRLPAETLASLKIGDFLCILPAHSCLTVQAMGYYLTLSGRRVEMMHN